jgi:guanosine-3',5'-bis(diphosphate) 3'-pyrophosphohydrolase
MSYKFELTCLSWECEGQTIRTYDGLKQAYEDLGNIEECPECGEVFKITENHISVRGTGTEISKNLGSLQKPSIIHKTIMTTFSDSDLGKIIKAIEFAAFKHRNQRRKGKEKLPYINHPIEILGILWRIGLVRYIPILIAAILHDIIEDTDTKPEEISSRFGHEVLNLVLEVTDDKSLPKEERKRLQIENAPSKSTGAKLIKIADKISNVSSWPDWPKQRFVEYLDWTENVMKGLRGTNLELENYYDLALNRSREKVAKEYTDEYSTKCCDLKTTKNE